MPSGRLCSPTARLSRRPAAGSATPAKGTPRHFMRQQRQTGDQCAPHGAGPPAVAFACFCPGQQLLQQCCHPHSQQHQAGYRQPCSQTTPWRAGNPQAPVGIRSSRHIASITPAANPPQRAMARRPGRKRAATSPPMPVLSPANIVNVSACSIKQHPISLFYKDMGCPKCLCRGSAPAAQKHPDLPLQRQRKAGLAVRVEVHPVRFTRLHIGVAVHEFTAGLPGGPLHQAGQQAGFFHAALAHFLAHPGHLMHPGINHDGRHDQHLGLTRPHRQLLCPRHQPGQPVGNVLGGGRIALLAVVGAQHHHQQIQRAVRVQRRGQVSKTAQPLGEGVLKHGGSAAHPFLGHQPAFAQLLLQQAGPACVVRIAAAGGRAVAPGVGIAVTYNMFSVHGCSTAFLRCFLPLL